MVNQPRTAVMTTRHARVRRHCSTICIALVIARFTPAITLTEPAPPATAHATAQATASATPATTTLPLAVYLCPTQDLCGTVTATITVAPRDTLH
jgi:hypothetical protein